MLKEISFGATPVKADYCLSKAGIGYFEKQVLNASKPESFNTLSSKISAMLSAKPVSGYERNGSLSNVLWFDTAHTARSLNSTGERILKEAGFDTKYIKDLPRDSVRFHMFSLRGIKPAERFDELEKLVKAYSPSVVVVDCENSISNEELRYIATRYDCHVTKITN
jgi:hypothetical protein